MKKGINIILIILTFSGSIVHGQIIGNYKSADFNFFELVVLNIFGSGHHIGGNELTLHLFSQHVVLYSLEHGTLLQTLSILTQRPSDGEMIAFNNLQTKVKRIN